MSNSTGEKPTVVIVGAGMSGLYLACLLGDRGYQVTVVEKRPRPGTPTADSARAVNYTLSHRGLLALRRIGLREEAIARSVEVTGRSVHLRDGNISEQNYRRPKTVPATYSNSYVSGLFSITRKSLEQLLLEAAERRTRVRILFEADCVELDRTVPKLKVRLRQHDLLTFTPTFVVGADGVSSFVRDAVQGLESSDFSRKDFGWVYKDFTLPSPRVEQLSLAANRVHLWPRFPSLMMGQPNEDGSMTFNLVVPEGVAGKLQSRKVVYSYLLREFADISLLAFAASSELVDKRWNKIGTMKTAPWFFSDKLVLVGDACHTVTHMDSQGLNASLEDCSVLMDKLKALPGARQEAFSQYYEARKKNSDALAAMSEDDFSTLMVKSASSRFEARQLFERLLVRWSGWSDVHAMLSHSSTPYADARKVAVAQNRLWKNVALHAVQEAISILVLFRRFSKIGLRRMFTQAQGLRQRISERAVDQATERLP